jgi:DNA-binding transcriptional ArsR family regulator
MLRYLDVLFWSFIMSDVSLDLMDFAFLEGAADCLKVMAHPVRLRIVNILMQGEFAVRQIAEMCEVSPNQACEHLRLMKGHGFLSSERRGKEVFYKIESPRLPSLLGCISQHCS